MNAQKWSADPNGEERDGKLYGLGVSDGYGLMLTCRACNVERHVYLVHVLTELPHRAPAADVIYLLPFNFAKLAAAANSAT